MIDFLGLNGLLLCPFHVRNGRPRRSRLGRAVSPVASYIVDIENCAIFGLGKAAEIKGIGIEIIPAA
jgi:hypothetical protein